MQIEFLLEAEEELIEAAAFYQARAEGLGEQFLSEIERSVRYLSEQPLMGQKLDESLRRFLLRRFPYALIYSAEPDTLLVVAVAHQRREPGYWRNRLED